MKSLMTQLDVLKIVFSLRNSGFVLGVARTAIPLRTATDFEIKKPYLFIELFSQFFGLLD